MNWVNCITSKEVYVVEVIFYELKICLRSMILRGF